MAGQLQKQFRHQVEVARAPLAQVTGRAQLQRPRAAAQAGQCIGQALSKLIDPQTKKAKGDPAKGEAYFNTLCAGCHGTDGKKVKDGPALGSVADNHFEMLHKVLNGQPGEGMPALRALDHQIAADIVSYLPSLPKE